MIKASKILAYFEDRFELSDSTKGWKIFDCPDCDNGRHKQKCAIHPTYQIVKCWECGVYEFATSYIKQYEDINIKSVYSLLKDYRQSKNKIVTQDIITEVKTSITLPKGFKGILEGDTITGKRARKYLTDRKLSLKRLDKIGVGYCDAGDWLGYIIIPFISKGVLQYYIGRDFIGNWLRYKNPDTADFNVGKADLLFNEDALYLYDEVAIFEGWTDAITWGKNSTAKQGWKLSEIQKGKIIKSPVKILVFFPDLGVDGKGVSFYEHQLKEALELVDHKFIKIVDLSRFEELGKDVNEIRKTNAMKCYNQTKILSYSDIINLI